MTHKPLACREESICRRAVSILHHRMRRPGDSHSGVSKSANHPSAIYAVLDAIQQCCHLMCASGSVEQGNWNLSSQRAVWRRQPVRCLIPVAQNIDRLRQCARSSDYHVRLLRRQTRWRSICVRIARLLPIRCVTERIDQSPKRSHRRQANRFRIDIRLAEENRFNQLNGCLRRQPLPRRAGEIEVRFDGCAEDPLSSKQIGNLRVHIQLSSQSNFKLQRIQ